jgi:plastocyanin
MRYQPYTLAIGCLALLCLAPQRAGAQYGHACGSAYVGGPAHYVPRAAHYYSVGPYYAAPAYGQSTWHPPYRPSPTYGPAPRQIYAQLDGSAPANYGRSRAAVRSPARPTTAVSVSIQDNSFQPPAIKIQPGSTVRWTNNGAHRHTVTARDNSWDSGDIAPGATYGATFQRPGTVQYYCRHHAGMQGAIIVHSGGSAAAASQLNNTPHEARSSAKPARSY